MKWYGTISTPDEFEFGGVVLEQASYEKCTNLLSTLIPLKNSV
jgi:hypothetical protein